MTWRRWRSGSRRVARRAGLPKSTAYRVLGMLVRVGAVEHEGTGYRIALQMMAIVQRRPKERSAIALPHLLDLHRAIGHTVHLRVLARPPGSTTGRTCRSRRASSAARSPGRTGSPCRNIPARKQLLS
ncbi:helix-turn-helix domain-containing protein [Streptomyces coeruleorubidus]|uniref:helix-turn-helix domain-containing protein n=1 Tax=Streptomyces coeruleorubidus TaxID=116188 RepID=UPI0036B06989